jgi:hypothetical protein
MSLGEPKVSLGEWGEGYEAPRSPGPRPMRLQKATRSFPLLPRMRGSRVCRSADVLVMHNAQLLGPRIRGEGG